MKVESKYKKPDTYIARLKGEKEFLQHRLNASQRREGEYVCAYEANGWNLSFSNSDRLAQLNPGDTVILSGIVRKVESCSRGNSSAVFDSRMVKVRKKIW